MNQPVAIDARVLRVIEDPTAEPFFEIAVSIGAPCRRCTLRTGFPARSREAALGRLRSWVALREPYVFVRAECGGGNAWGCSTETVWRVDGKGCQPVGVFIVTDESDNAGVALRGGKFHDWYDKLESAELPLSHARMPGFETVLVARAGNLVTDLDATWRVNDEAFQKAMTTAMQFTRDSVPDEVERREGPVAEFAKALAIAKFCGKTSVVDELLARAWATLPAEDVQALERLLGLVVTGEVLAERRLSESCVA